ncbi:MAG: hypothetical protein AAGM67_01200 [Bacteroidota bacterium]
MMDPDLEEKDGEATAPLQQTTSGSSQQDLGVQVSDFARPASGRKFCAAAAYTATLRNLSRRHHVWQIIMAEDQTILETAETQDHVMAMIGGDARTWAFTTQSSVTRSLLQQMTEAITEERTAEPADEKHPSAPTSAEFLEQQTELIREFRNVRVESANENKRSLEAMANGSKQSGGKSSRQNKMLSTIASVLKLPRLSSPTNLAMDAKFANDLAQSRRKIFDYIERNGFSFSLAEAYLGQLLQGSKADDFRRCVQSSRYEEMFKRNERTAFEFAVSKLTLQNLNTRPENWKAEWNALKNERFDSLSALWEKYSGLLLRYPEQDKKRGRCSTS